MQAPIPTSIGGYTVERKLSQGGMGAVLLGAKQSAGGFKKRVAIKVVLPQYGANEDYRTLFFDEARLVARMNHPHLCQVFDFGEDDKVLFLVMEYVEGLSVERIQELCREHRLRIPPPLATLIVAHAARGLHHAHSLTGDDGEKLNVVHRDVSPQNLIVTDSGSTKLIDFGIAKHTARQNQTQLGVVRGKPGYMAPEQARGEELDARTDIFQLGIVLYELLTQKPLFARDNVYESIRLAVEMPIEKTAPLFGDVDPALDDILAGALAKDPDQRFSSADAMARALDSVLVRYGGKTGEAALGDFVRSLHAADGKAESAAATLPTETSPRPTGEATAQLASTGPAVRQTVVLDEAKTPAPAATTPDTPSSIPTSPAPMPTPPEPSDPAVQVFGTRDVEQLAFGPSRRLPIALFGAAVLLLFLVGGLAFSGVFSSSADDPARVVEVEPSAPPLDPTPQDPAPEPTVAAAPDAGPRAAAVDEGKPQRPKRKKPRRKKKTAPDVEDNVNADAKPAEKKPGPAEGVETQTPPPTVVKKETTYGKLTVAATDNFRVLVDKRDVGGTPLFGHKLSTGPHTVELVLPNGAVSETRQVRIHEGKTTRIKARQ